MKSLFEWNIRFLIFSGIIRNGCGFPSRAKRGERINTVSASKRTTRKTVRLSEFRLSHSTRASGRECLQEFSGKLNNRRHCNYTHLLGRAMLVPMQPFSLFLPSLLGVVCPIAKFHDGAALDWIVPQRSSAGSRSRLRCLLLLAPHYLDSLAGKPPIGYRGQYSKARTV